MNAIAGIVGRDGAPGMGLVPLAARQGPRPVRSAHAEVLTWEGRLDNAGELRRQLGLSGPAAPGDAQVVLAAYERWGREFLPRLLGDFVLALWDARLSTLLLARDVFGSRPLFYREEAGRVLWDTRLSPLLQAAGLPAEPDEAWIAGFLTRSPPEACTPFQGLRTLPAGHALEVSREGRRLWRYWAPRPGEAVRLGSDAEYEERFRELFAESVRARLPVEGPVFAELSGGVDSSSVACMARHLLSTGQGTASELRTVSFVYERSRTSDERPFIRAVEERLGQLGLHLGEDHLSLPSLDAPCPEVPTYTHCLQGQYAALSAHMRERGARVLLTGFGGDSLTWSEVETPLEVADLLRQGRLGALPRSLRTWREALDVPYLQLLWEGGLRPLLPDWARRGVHPPRPLPDWLAPDFVRSTGLHAWREPPGPGGPVLPSQRAHAGHIQGDIRILSWHSQCSGALDLDTAHPFLHRPLVEFCLSVPLSQWLRGRETRSLHRRALRGLLPERVAWRRTKQGPDEAYHRLLGREWSQVEALLADSRLVRRGYVEPGRFRVAFQQARFGLNARLLLLLRALALEYWLRALETGNLVSG